MSKNSKTFVTLTVVILGAVAVFGVQAYFNARKGAVQAADVRTKGNPGADIQIVEYIDFQCPACAEGAKVLRDYLERYPEQLFLQMKYYPLQSIHRHAIMSAKYAECAARQGKFWEMHDYLIDRQSDWRNARDAEPLFDIMAQNIGLDEGQLESCLVDESIEKKILESKDEGRALGVKSTPTYFINEEMVVGFRNLKDKLDELLKEPDGD